MAEDETTGTARPEDGATPSERDGQMSGEGTTAADTGDTADTELLRTDDAERPRRRGPDALTLLVGLATLAMAVFAFVGELPDLSFVDPRWVFAGGAAVVGLALLAGNLRRRPRGGG